MNEPNTAPPENVALIAPMVAEAAVVLKVLRKLGDWMTIVITPLSYPTHMAMRSVDIQRVNEAWNSHQRESYQWQQTPRGQH
jgi:hypothetical protein